MPVYRVFLLRFFLQRRENPGDRKTLVLFYRVFINFMDVCEEEKTGHANKMRGMKYAICFYFLKNHQFSGIYLHLFFQALVVLLLSCLRF